MKSRIYKQWKVIKGVKEQVAYVVKEQKKNTEQRNEFEKMKEI